MSTAEHPRRRDPAERAAAKPTGPEELMTPVSPAMHEAAKQTAALDRLLAKVESDPYEVTSDPKAAEAAQAAAIAAFLADFVIETPAVAEWAAAKVAEAEHHVDDLAAAYAEVKDEWERRLKQAKRAQEIRTGLFREALEEYGAKELGLPPLDEYLALTDRQRAKLPKSLVVGPRRLAFRYAKDSIVIGDREKLIERIKAEDPTMAEARLKIEYVVADLDAEKRAALAKYEESGKAPAGFNVKPGERNFYVQPPKEKP